MTDPIYAVGDIHGQSEMLDQALALIAADGGPQARIVFLGDYTDRGPDSAGVLDRLIEGQAQGRPWITLKGNHDRMFEWFMEDPPRHDSHLLVGYHWLHDRIGGVQTLASYSVPVPDRIRLEALRETAGQAVPQSHVDFLRGLRLSYQVDDLLFVHAGIRPGIGLAEQSEQDMIWIREPFLSCPDPHPWLVVHGHTALEHPTHFGNRVDLDGGAGYGRPILPAVFENRTCWLLTEQGRVPLTPS